MNSKEKGNVLVIGNSGVGKSTLINAVLGEKVAKTNFGSKGVTYNITPYENDEIDFRIIDTIGFEPSFFKERKAIKSIRTWQKFAEEKGCSNNKINVIWFCVEGTSGKLFPKAIEDMVRATKIWKSVPIIVVITKSYSTTDRVNNIEMVKNVFKEKKELNDRLECIIPVVASVFTVNNDVLVVPEGIMELIDETNRVMPEGLKAGEKDLFDYKLKRKRALVQRQINIFLYLTGRI